MSSSVLPAPTGPATVAQSFAEVLAEVVGAERASPDAHFFDDLGADSMLMARFCARVRKRPDLPSVSMKDVYAHPTVRGLAEALEPQPGPLERSFAEVLADVLDTGQVSVASHFFDDLGADSMLMARFCARIRKRADLPSVSMKDVYAHPTIRSLATALAPASSAADAVPASTSVPAESGAAERVAPAGRWRVALCGTLQLLFFLGCSYATAWVAVLGYGWITAGSSPVDFYLRSVAFVTVGFAVACLLPIMAKWVLVGRWKPQQIAVWSLTYLRFWLVKTLIRANPLVLFRGSPLYVLYLRSLGAKIGRNVLILSQHVPVSTDLLTVGAGTVIRKDAYFSCYRARAGLIEIGPVTLGRDVLVSEATVLDIGTTMGDGAQLGHVSSLHSGQCVPAGQSWHGSPAQPAGVDYRRVPQTGISRLRGAVYSIGHLLVVLVVYLPLIVGGVGILVALPRVQAVLTSPRLGVSDWVLYADAAAFSFALFVGLMAIGLLIMLSVPRLLNLAIKQDTNYPLYGLRYSCHRTIARTTNLRFFTNLFGDSSYIVGYLRVLGYHLTPVVQTGSNFGTEVRHESPYLVSVGTGTVCASELSIVNADYSSSSFRVSRASIGAHNFLGNLISYPAGSRTGDNCLLATKVHVPVDGKIRENVGLLGSPSFEIPRTVERDNAFQHMTAGDALRRRLSRKNRHNVVSIVLLLVARWFSLFVVTLIGFGAAYLYPFLGVAAITLATLTTLVFTVAYGVFVERASTGFRPLPTKYCSIYDVNFWRTERFFKLETQATGIFNGTPFKGPVLRALGAKVGKRLFDDGGSMAEKNLVTIGDDVMLNAGCWLQCHSQEDYVFKSDRIDIGSRCTIGVGAMVLYRAVMGDDAVLAPDSFLMKGEVVPPHARWGGNPAQELSTLPIGAGPKPVVPVIPPVDRRSRIRLGRVAAALVALALPVGTAGAANPDAPTTVATSKPTVQVTTAPVQPAAAPGAMEIAPKAAKPAPTTSTTKTATKPTTKATRVTMTTSTQRGRA